MMNQVIELTAEQILLQKKEKNKGYQKKYRGDKKIAEEQVRVLTQELNEKENINQQLHVELAAKDQIIQDLEETKISDIQEVIVAQNKEVLKILNEQGIQLKTLMNAISTLNNNQNIILNTLSTKIDNIGVNKLPTINNFQTPTANYNVPTAIQKETVNSGFGRSSMVNYNTPTAFRNLPNVVTHPI